MVRTVYILRQPFFTLALTWIPYQHRENCETPHQLLFETPVYCNEKCIEAQQIRSKWQNWNWQRSRKNLLISSPTVNLITYSGKINTINWLKTDKPPRYMVRQVNLWHFCKSTHSFGGTHYKWWQHYRPVMTAKTQKLKCYIYFWKKNQHQNAKYWQEQSWSSCPYAITFTANSIQPFNNPMLLKLVQISNWVTSSPVELFWTAKNYFEHVRGRTWWHCEKVSSGNSVRWDDTYRFPLCSKQIESGGG